MRAPLFSGWRLFSDPEGPGWVVFALLVEVPVLLPPVAINAATIFDYDPPGMHDWNFVELTTKRQLWCYLAIGQTGYWLQTRTFTDGANPKYSPNDGPNGIQSS